MTKRVTLLIFGTLTASICAFWYSYGVMLEERNLRASLHNALTENEKKIADLVKQNDELTKKLSQFAANVPSAIPTVAAPPASQPEAGARSSASESTASAFRFSDEDRKLMAESRIRAIGKIVTLTDEQRAKLTEKFSEPGGMWGRGDDLADIIGKENADFLKEQRRRSFEVARDEATEKEILFVGRKLQLSQNQEQQIRTIYSDTEKEVRAQMIELYGDVTNPRQGGRQSMMTRMLNENRIRDSILNAKLKEVLDSQQYDNYLALQATSAGQELELWHGQ